MTDRLITYLKNRQVHTPGIALARCLLAFGMLLTILFNDMSVVANHSYDHLPQYKARHTATASVPLKQLDIFMQMPPGVGKGVAIVALLLVMTGLIPKVTSVLHFIVCFSFHNYFLIINGGDEVTFVMSLLLLPLCLTDPRLNQWKRAAPVPRSGNITAAVALFVIQVQAAYVYFSAGYGKLFTNVWRKGTAVYYYTSHYRLGAKGFLLSINEWVTRGPGVYVLTWGTIIFELGLAACLFLPDRYRKKMFIPAIIFHALIMVQFGLVSFFFAMAGMLVLYLRPGTKQVQDM